MIDPITTVLALIHALRGLITIFKHVKEWLKRKSNQLYNADYHMLKALKAYSEAKKDRPYESLPTHIQSIANHLNTTSKREWQNAPNAAYAISQAEYEEDGDSVPSLSGDETDSSNNEEEDSPSHSPQVSDETNSDDEADPDNEVEISPLGSDDE